ncbi:MAG: 1-deoxy-D-xylulose-5-phosphate reductoisomerase [Candidatus Saganbacteria bacterium]|nr:1-deoxy-D-xylulose-5-phosphate reductoisomerase [Candidatus Saganbacteria bacterium]
MKKRIAVLGSTGSIGKQVLEAVSAFPSLFTINGLATKGYLDIFKKQIKEFKPKHAIVNDEKGLIKIATDPGTDIVVMSIVGTAGLPATIAAIKKGKTILLASKEILVAAGDIVMPLAKKYRAKILPLDSEHSAVFQCLGGKSEIRSTKSPSTSLGASEKNSKFKIQNNRIKKIILTASGGPFRAYSKAQLKKVTAKQALAHPTWKMGPKITIDSATLMNKGLEVIEAHHLFGVPYDKIEVVVHPQSIIHSMVEFTDGSILAQMGAPDMRTPIQYALHYPDRAPKSFETIDISKAGQLTFEKPDADRFPCLKIAYQAGKTGGTMPAVMSAANDTAVEMFLKGKIRFTDIPKIVLSVMKKHEFIRKPSLAQILKAEKWARTEAGV